MRITLGVVLALSPVAVFAEPSMQDMPGWMTGAWEKIDGTKWADEFWTPPRGGSMIGSSRSGSGNQLGFWEHMRIMRETDGQLAFWAIAADQKPVRFAAVKTAANEIVFENAQHDYPQRIRYWRDGKALMAEISLLDGSRAVKFGFDPMGGI